MEMRCCALIMYSVLAALCIAVSWVNALAANRQYLNEWAVEIPGGIDAAREIARELDYELIRQVGTTWTLDLNSLCCLFTTDKLVRTVRMAFIFVIHGLTSLCMSVTAR